MIRVNAERLWSTLEMMAQIGGTPAGGVTRLALSEEDRIARNLLRDWALDAGFTCDVDSMGNMFIRRAGKNPQLAPVMTGSHVDTQPLGGNYDGVYGVLAGLELLRTLNDYHVETERDVVLVNWTNEEGARFAPAMLSSGVWTGQFSEAYAHARADNDGITVGEALESMGYRGEAPARAFPVHACYELHIERATIGMAKVTPNSRNVVPSRVECSVEFRHPAQQALETMEAALHKVAESLRLRGVAAAVERIFDYAPIAFDAECLARTEKAVAALGYSSKPMVSGAGHDACYVSKIAPASMIFIPCVKGISHNEAERILPEWSEKGANVLLHSVLSAALER